MFRPKNDFSEQLSKTYDYYSKPQSAHRALMLNERNVVDASLDTPQYSAQKELRALFGKTGSNPSDFGDHPDFRHLKGTDGSEYHPVTTLFIDLESSTRLGVLYPPEEVKKIKNAFISTAIEIIKSFDGHVHRIMGDAVMAFFGRKGQRSENAAIDAVNCSAVLIAFVEKVVIPKIKANGYDDSFGIRIGLDHGKEKDVLWSSYGQLGTGMEEVTATSFFVDVASKLQSAAGRNQVMLGESLRSLLDFPQELLDLKYKVRDGVLQPIPYLMPNITDRHGKPINYKQHQLNWEKYLELSPIAIIENIKIEAELYSYDKTTFLRKFPSVSSILPKGHWVKFKLALPFVPRLPYRIRFSVENHGAEAFEDKGQNRGNHFTDKEINTQWQHNNIQHWEATQYRGLHFLIIEITTNAGKVGTARFALYIE